MFGVTDKDIQFGRQCSVIFDNYTTGESILVKDYSKLFDEIDKCVQTDLVGVHVLTDKKEGDNSSSFYTI